MEHLAQLAESRPEWSLAEFVAVTNELLPDFMPVEKGNTKVREQVTPRLVRHYTGLGMLDEPLKAGREARYHYRHLLQLLVVRRLLAEGYGASAIDDLAASSDNARLEALLRGGAQLSVTVANPALAFLNEIQQRQQLPKPGAPRPLPAAPIIAAPPRPTTTSRWTRLEILPGFEIQIGDEFTYPNSSHEQQALLHHIAQKLEQFATQRRSTK
jgi:DNA-binding transcriptional MerR regulator